MLTGDCNSKDFSYLCHVSTDIISAVKSNKLYSTKTFLILYSLHERLTKPLLRKISFARKPLINCCIYVQSVPQQKSIAQRKTYFGVQF